LALFDSNLENVSERFKAEPVLTRQCAATFNIMIDQADAALKSWTVRFTLSLEIFNELLILRVD